MIIPEKVCESIWKHAAPYLDKPIPDGYTLGSILNAIAWENRTEEYRDASGNIATREAWGLSRKNGGKNVDSPVGLIAEDILHHKPTNLLFDIFKGADVGLILRPNCGGDIGPPTSNDRTWVKPVQPVGFKPTPIPDPEVPPMSTVECKFHTNTGLETSINLLGARLDALSAELKELSKQIQEAQDQINTALTAEVNRGRDETTENLIGWLRTNRVKASLW